MKEPINGPRSRLRVVANSLVKAIPDRNCIDWSAPGSGTIFGGIVGSKGFRGRSLGMPDPPSSDSSTMGEMYIAAGKPITLVFMTTPEGIRANGITYRCSIAASFTPKAGKDYEATLKFDAKTTTCFAAVEMLGQIREPVQVSRAQQCK